MAFGAVRRSYSAPCRFYSDDSLRDNRINWYVVPRDTPIYEGKTVFWPRIDDLENETPYTYEQSGTARTIRKYFPFHHPAARPGDHVHGDPEDFEGLSPRSKYWIAGVPPVEPCAVDESRAYGIKLGIVQVVPFGGIFSFGLAIGFKRGLPDPTFPPADGGLMFNGSAKLLTNHPPIGNGGLMLNGVAILTTNVPAIGNGGLMLNGVAMLTTNVPAIGDGGVRLNGFVLVTDNIPDIGNGGVMLDGTAPITDNLPNIGDGGIMLDGMVPFTDNLPNIGDGGIKLDGTVAFIDNLPNIGDGGIKLDGTVAFIDNLPNIGDGGIKLNGTVAFIDNLPNIGDGGIKLDGSTPEADNVPRAGDGGIPLDGMSPFSDNSPHAGDGGLMFNGSAEISYIAPPAGDGGLMFNGSAPVEPLGTVGAVLGIQLNFAAIVTSSPPAISDGGLRFNGSADVAFGNVTDLIQRYPLGTASSGGLESTSISRSISGVRAGLLVVNVARHHMPDTGSMISVSYGATAMLNVIVISNGQDAVPNYTDGATYVLPVTAGGDTVTFLSSGGGALQMTITNVTGLALNSDESVKAGAASVPLPIVPPDTGPIGPTTAVVSYLNGMVCMISPTGDTPMGGFTRGQSVSDTWSGFTVELFEMYKIVAGSTMFDVGIVETADAWVALGEAFE